MSLSRRFVFGFILLFSVSAIARNSASQMYFIQAEAKNKIERTKIANAGIAIDGVLSDSVTIFGTAFEVERLKRLGIKLEVSPLPENALNFPGGDEAFHDHKETLEALDKLARTYPDLVTRISIGKSLENRELAGVRLSTNPNPDSLPTAIFVGCHHAREHLSVEIPLMMAEYLAKNYANDDRIKFLYFLDTILSQ